MQGKLEYNLPEEQEEFELACKAEQMSAQLDDIKNEIRKVRKYTEFKNKEVEINKEIDANRKQLEHESHTLNKAKEEHAKNIKAETENLLKATQNLNDPVIHKNSK